MKTAKIVALTLFIIILSGGIIELVYASNTFDKLDKYIEDISQYIQADELDIALTKTQECIEWWRVPSKIFESLTNTRDTKQVAMQLSLLEGSLLTESQSDATINITALETISKNLRDTLSFRIEHVL